MPTVEFNILSEKGLFNDIIALIGTGLFSREQLHKALFEIIIDAFYEHNTALKLHEFPCIK